MMKKRNVYKIYKKREMHMESNPSQVKNGVLFLIDVYSEIINPNIQFIDKNKINIDRVPYLEVYKEKVIYILMVLFNFNNSFLLYINIPNEIIRLISYHYLNILKIINIKSIDLQNICPCDDRLCLLEWFDYYASYTSPSDQKIKLFHCDVEFEKNICHFIGTIDNNGWYCVECNRYCCERCTNIMDEKREYSDDDEEYSQYECIECRSIK